MVKITHVYNVFNHALLSHCVPFNLKFACFALWSFTSNIISINILVNIIINSRGRPVPTPINSTGKGL